MSTKRYQQPIRLGLIGSIIFGCVLFAFGFAFKRFLGEPGPLSVHDALMCSRAGLGAMILGGIIVIGNILWLGFILVVYFTDKS